MTELPIEAMPKRRRLAKPANSSRESGGGRKVSRDASSKLKIQIDFPGGARLGPGKVALLEAIDAEGSLSRAAQKIDMSYRRAWLFMQQINQAFDEVAVATPEGGHGGGPAKLTAFGRELIRHYRNIEEQAARSSAEILNWLDRHKSSRSGGSRSEEGQ